MLTLKPVVGFVSGFVTAVILGGLFLQTVPTTENMTMRHSSEALGTEYNLEVVAEVERGTQSLLDQGRYKCCIQKPCSYCFTDKEHHEEELVCDCLEDIMNGEHPCGECIGEILEGNGNPLISEYFAVAIADELGETYLGTLRSMIAEKYDMPIDQQL